MYLIHVFIFYVYIYNLDVNSRNDVGIFYAVKSVFIA